jgi:hypothetical protein
MNVSFKGDWNIGTTYDQGDFVVYENIMYIALSNILSGQLPPNNNASWDLVVYGGEFEPSATPTNTPTTTPTPTQTKTSTPTVTPTVTPSNTQTPTLTPTLTPTNTPTNTITPTNSVTPTSSITPTVTKTPTNTITPTNTPTPTVSTSVVASPTPTPTTTTTPTPTPGGGWFFYDADGAPVSKTPNMNGNTSFNLAGITVYNPNYISGTLRLIFYNINLGGTSYASQFSTLNTAGGTITISQGSSTVIYSGTSADYVGTASVIRLDVSRSAQMIQAASTPFVSGISINVVTS